MAGQMIWSIAGQKSRPITFCLRSRLKTSGGSYPASHDLREIPALGSEAKIDSVEIRSPSGRVDKLSLETIDK